MTRTSVLVVGLLLLVATSGCGGDGETEGPRSTAKAFERAVESDDGAAACDLLAPKTRDELEQSAGTPCAEAILAEDLPAAGASTESSAYGSMAQVRFTGDTLFLAEFPDGWRVLAAGCAPKPKAPYDCVVQGG